MYNHDYLAYHVAQRHREQLARAALHRAVPRRARPPTRWRRLAAHTLVRLAQRLADEPLVVSERRA